MKEICIMHSLVDGCILPFRLDKWMNDFVFHIILLTISKVNILFR